MIEKRTQERREVYMKMKKLLLLFVVLTCMATVFFACNNRTDADGNEIDYSSVKSVEIDKTSVEYGFMLSDFDISKVILIVTYTADSAKANELKEQQDAEAAEKGTTVTEYNYSVKMNATMDMVKAEDIEKLSTAGRKTITLIYGKFTISFVLELIDDTETNLYLVTF